MTEFNRNLSFDAVTLLTTSTINTLHFPGLSASGISDGGGSRRASFLLDGIGMCESMTESFCSTGGQDDVHHPDTSMTNNNSKLERKDSTKKRRSRKAQYDATLDGVNLDKIETVNPFDTAIEADDAWLIDVPINGDKQETSRENIYSWVHKEFQSNDINANKHRLLCKLDDMSNARTIRSVSCHNFLDDQRFENIRRSPPDQEVHSEPIKSVRLTSPLRSSVPSSQIESMKSSISNGNSASIARSREASRERLDYTDLEVMAKVQLENLRQADRQAPLTKRLGDSNISLASTSSSSTIKSSTTKPPLAPKSAVIRSSVRPISSYQRSNTQTVVSTSSETHPITGSKPPVTLATRVSLLPNSANNNRTRPPTTLRPIPTYRGSQTNLNTAHNKPQIGSSSAQRPTKPVSNDVSNGLLNDVSNKPLTGPLRSQVGAQRRTMLPQTALPRSSSSSFSQGRKSGIPTAADKPQKPTTSTLTRHHSLTSRRTTVNRF